MKTTLHENNLDCYEKTFEQRKMFELTGETVVSDKMPDIGLLGETIAHVLLRGKRTENGSGTLEGELMTTVCFLPDGVDGCCSMELNLPWRVDFESENITDRCSAIGDIRVAALETRMLNPRKVLVKVQMEALFTAYEKKTVKVCVPKDMNPAVQIRSSTIDCAMVGTVCEKTFVAADEYPLPADMIGGNVLCKSVQLRTDDVKTLTNKLIIKGTVISDVIMMNPQGEAERICFTSGFSFIAETDCEAVSSDTKLVLMPNALYYEITSDGRILSVEVHGVCQILAYAKRKLDYISDVYSNFYECHLETTEHTVVLDTKFNTQREQVVVTIPTRSHIAKVCFATAYVNGYHQSVKNSQVSVHTTACILYENGTRDWVKKDTAVEFKIKEYEKLQCVRVSDIYIVENGNEAELRISLEADLYEERESILQMICAIETDEEHPSCRMRPTLSVVRRGGELWELAKEYGSTTELIKTYNQIEDDEVESNQILLIPKQVI